MIFFIFACLNYCLTLTFSPSNAPGTGIETSCDETAISIIDIKGGFSNTKIEILADKVLTQIEIHKQYGGVFPALAKREHAKNILPLLKNTLKQAGLF